MKKESLLFNKNHFFILNLLLFSLFLSSCERLNNDWHKYEKRKFEIIGKDRQFVEVVSDGWKIIDKVDDTTNEYEWGWEITIKTRTDPNAKELKFDDGTVLIPSIYIKKIQYVLVDKDDFELTSDVLKDQFIDYGQTLTFRNTSRISKRKALRAVNSYYRIILD